MPDGVIGARSLTLRAQLDLSKPEEFEFGEQIAGRIGVAEGVGGLRIALDEAAESMGIDIGRDSPGSVRATIRRRP